MPRRSFFRRAIRFVFVLTTTAAVIAGAGYAVQTGSTLLAARAADAPPPDPAPLIAVRVRALSQDTGYSVPRSFVDARQNRRIARDNISYFAKCIGNTFETGLNRYG